MTTRIADAARSLSDARAAVAAALVVLHDAVRAEVADGMSAVEAARQAGVTRQRVYNIVRAGAVQYGRVPGGYEARLGDKVAVYDDEGNKISEG